MTREVTAEPSLTLRRIQLLLIAELLFAFAVPSISSAAEQRAMPDALTETRPWLAPTGHRQPRADDVPQELSGINDQLYAALDRRLRICCGC
jgi:hypothetical protein